MSEITVLELIDKYVEGCISDEEAEILRQWLSASDDHMRLFFSYTHLHLELRHELVAEDRATSYQQMLEASGSFNGVVFDESKGTVPLQDLPEIDVPSRKKRSTSSTRDQEDRHEQLVAKLGGLRVYRKEVEVEPTRRIRRLAAAAVILIAVLGTWWFMQPKPIATLAQQNNAEWSDTDTPPVVGGLLANGHYELTQGFAELRFMDGTTVLLEAPAEFDLTGPDTMALLRGKLAANISKSTDRFVVSTPFTQVVDLGTEFGVGVKDNGQTMVAVFDGTVQLADSSSVADPSATESLVVEADHQAHVLSYGNLPKQAQPLDPAHPFTRDIEEAHHLLRVEGQVRWYRSPPETDLSELQFDGHMIVFRERTNIRSNVELSGPVTESGRRTGRQVNPNKPMRLPADQAFDSYMINYNGGNVEIEDAKRPLTGQITFPRPIVSLLVHSTDLFITDEQFGSPLTLYREAQDYENEAGSYRGLETAIDFVEISEDRRTLTFGLYAGKTKSDQLRVLIESR